MFTRINASVKKFFRELAERHVGWFERRNIKPDDLTKTGVVLCVVASVIVAFEAHSPVMLYRLGAGVFLFGSILDVMDGALARMTHQSTPWGMYLDSNTDRVGETAMLLAIIAVFYHQREFVPLMFSATAIGTTHQVTFSRAKTEAMGLESKKEVIGERLHRLIVLVAGLILAPWFGLEWVVYVLVVITTWGWVLRVLSTRTLLAVKQAEEQQ